MLHLRTFSPNSAVSNLMLGSIKEKWSFILPYP